MTAPIDVFKAATRFCMEIDSFMEAKSITSVESEDFKVKRQHFDHVIDQWTQSEEIEPIIKKYRISVALAALKEIQLKIADLLVEKQIFSKVSLIQLNQKEDAKAKLLEHHDKGKNFYEKLSQYPLKDSLERLIMDLECEGLIEEAHLINFQFSKRQSRRIDNDYSIECRAKELETLSSNYSQRCKLIYESN